MFENMPDIFPHTTKHKMETKYFFIQMFSLVKTFFFCRRTLYFFICENTLKKKNLVFLSHV